MGNLIFYFILSLVMSLGLGAPSVWLAERLGLMDVPGSAPHKQHIRPTPLAGGIMMVIVLGAMLIFFRKFLDREIVVVFVGAAVIFLFGLWDDSKGLSAIPKLVGQLIASAILLAGGIQVRFMTILFADTGLSYEFAQGLNILITLFWLIGITNALNMIDSMDGIVAGIGVIASAFFMGASVLSAQDSLSRWAAVLLGLGIGLYIWNGLAARFFLGDSGAQTMGFLLASFGILYNPLNRNPESSWIVPIMLLSVPIFDTTLVVLSRLRRRQRIGSGRRDHTYHRLIRLGLSPRMAVLITHLSAFLIGFLAFINLYLPVHIALFIFTATIFSGWIVLLWLERKPALDEPA